MMPITKINLKEVRKKAAQRDIFTIAQLADRVGCRRETIYFAIAQPERYPRAFRRLLEVINA